MGRYTRKKNGASTDRYATFLWSHRPVTVPCYIAETASSVLITELAMNLKLVSQDRLVTVSKLRVDSRGSRVRHDRDLRSLLQKLP